VKCGEEVCCGFEVSRCDAAEVLETIEEPFDLVALAVEVSVDGPDHAGVGLAGDVGGGARRLDGRDHGLCEVAPVADDISGEAKGTDKLGRGGLVGGLPRRQDEPDRQAAPVPDGVDLCRQASPRPSDGVIRAPFFPPAACWWARTIELSIRCRELGDFSARASKMRSQTPAFAHLL